MLFLIYTFDGMYMQKLCILAYYLPIVCIEIVDLYECVYIVYCIQDRWDQSCVCRWVFFTEARKRILYNSTWCAKMNIFDIRTDHIKLFFSPGGKEITCKSMTSWSSLPCITLKFCWAVSAFRYSVLHLLWILFISFRNHIEVKWKQLIKLVFWIFDQLLFSKRRAQKRFFVSNYQIWVSPIKLIIWTFAFNT